MGLIKIEDLSEDTVNIWQRDHYSESDFYKEAKQPN